MNILFVNWSAAIVLASITMLSPVALNKSAKVSPVIETEVAPKGCAVNFNDEKVLFLYDKSQGFSEAAVTNPDNWSQSTVKPEDCSDDDEVACAIRVSEDFVDETGLEPKLDASIALQALQFGSSGRHYISGSANASMDIINNAFIPVN